MTDLLFPIEVPDQRLLSFIVARRYIPDDRCNNDGFFNVNTCDRTGKKVDKPLQVPRYYLDHLRHFTWRHHVYMELNDRAVALNLDHGLQQLLQKYIFYMNGILQGLLGPVRKHHNDVTFRSRLFDGYLAVEYHVGRHEFDIVGAWRDQHPDVLLECESEDITDTGMLHYHLILNFILHTSCMDRMV